ncbi:MAG: right-handed parallel beta-helix repeat-containing protein, partial [Candidatus Nanoarchaeia archaeon]|nr:right-handed parallel beta-helix repeat-containing protein [Candidatus Nanoarchaeia archaeon]
MINKKEAMQMICKTKKGLFIFLFVIFIFGVIIPDVLAANYVYPQQWATGDGTKNNPWANDCIKKAYDKTPVGGTIYLKEGYYQLGNSGCTIQKAVNIIGEGINKTIITTGTGTGFYLFHVDHVTLEGFTLDASQQKKGHPWYESVHMGIGIHDGDFLILEDLEVKNSGSYGINIFDATHSLFQNLYVHDNYFHNVHPGTNVARGGRADGNMYNTYRNIYVYDSEIGGGFCEIGSVTYPDKVLHNVYDNIQAKNNKQTGVDISNQRGGTISNCIASGQGTAGFPLYNIEDFTITNCTATGNDHGIFIELNSKNIKINDCTVSSNKEHGIRVEDSQNVEINSCVVNNNNKDGIYLNKANDVTLTNVIAKNNNNYVSTYDGIDIKDSNNIILTSCQSYDDRNPPLQTYGVALDGNSRGITLTNCILSPNRKGEIYNPAGAAIIKSESYCVDNDNDGYGSPASSDCAHSQLDCNDNNNHINPGADEICNDNLDNDCDGLVDS